MDAHDFFEIVARHLVEDLVAKDPGVVDNDINLPELVDRRLDYAPGSVLLCDAFGVRDGIAAGRANLLDDRVRRARIAATAFCTAP